MNGNEHGVKGVELLAVNRMFIGPCIIIIVEELETNLMSLVMSNK